MMVPSKDHPETIQKDTPTDERLEPTAPPPSYDEPTAPPPPSYDDVVAEDEKLRLEDKPDPGDNLIPDANKPQCQGPWESDKLGELVVDHKDPKHVKRKRQRKAKKAMGWTAWVVCCPLVALMNCARDSPQDPNDPHDWNNDPLRPWNYRVNLDTNSH